MLKERETYTATKGVENEGYEFEVAMLCFYCFHLCYNEDIRDFKIAIYDDKYHPFDDIVIDITTEVTEKYAIQLKHVKDRLLMNANHFGKNGKMVLSKYFKFDFSKSDHVVLLTNGVVNEEMAVGNCSIKLKRDLTQMERALDTSEEEENHIFEIRDEETSSRVTFYTAQKNRLDIDKTMKQKIKQKFFLDDRSVEVAIQKLKVFFQQWKKGSYGLCKLDKQDIKMKIAEVLLHEHIVEYEPHFGDHLQAKGVLLRNVLSNFQITIGRDTQRGDISSLCYFDMDVKTVIASGIELLILANESSHRELVTLLWRLKKFPLILAVDDDNIETICEVINDLRDENLSFLLLGDISRADLEPLRVFETLKDLENEDYFEEIIEEFKLSIQGQEKISLKTLIQCNLNFCTVFTLKQLLSIVTDDFVVGEEEENLPQPYISRNVLTTVIKISSLRSFPKDVFAISGPYETIESKLPKCKFWKFQDFAEENSLGIRLPPKSIILCAEETKHFATCLKYKNSNVHCCKVIDEEHLQVVYSKEKCEKLRKVQILPEDQLHGLLKTKINLICARPGMGKLTMLKFLRRNCLPGFWTMKVDLQEEDQDFFKSDGSFVAKIRECFREVRRVIFFFHGIDNLQNQCLIKATKMIQKLADDNYQVWVFSEDHLKETLEKIFDVCSMEIEKISEDDQKRYIHERLKNRHVDEELDKVITNLKMLKNNDILGAPMHLYMLTEIFINNPDAKMEEMFILNNIYQYFIRTKYQHYLSKISSEHPNQIIEDGIFYRNEQYKLAAVSGLDSVNFNKQCDSYFLDQVRRIGDVVGIIFKISYDGSSIIFSQQTYADYFAALWLASNYRHVEMKKFIFREEFKNILFMFNLEICKQNPCHIATLYQNYQQLRKYKDHVNDLDSLGRSAFHLACSYGTHVKNEEKSFKFEKEDNEMKKIVDYLVDNVTINPLQKDIFLDWNLLDYAFNTLNLYAVEKIVSKYPKTSQNILDHLTNFDDDSLFTIIHYAVKFGYQNLLDLCSRLPLFENALSFENCNGETLLYLAVKTSNSSIVSILLNSGAKVDAVTSSYNKRSPLHLSVEKNCSDILELLLERGASVDIMDRYRNTPLHLASSSGPCNLVEVLLKYGADVNFADNFGRTPLQLAATYGHIKIIKVLLKNGAQIDKCDKFGNSALCTARDKKHEQIVSLLSKKGAKSPTGNIRRLSSSEFDEYTTHQLHWVCFTGQTERVDSLLEDGWSINDVDSCGRTPLYRAVCERYIDIVDKLIDKGADVNIPDNSGITPLCRAISNADCEIIKLLIDANIDIKDNFGYTPLHWAAFVGNCDIVKILLGKNPDVEAVDSFGRKAIHCAVENGHFDIVAALGTDISKLEVAHLRSKFLAHYDSITEKINTTRHLTTFQDAVNSGTCSLVRKFLKQERNQKDLDDSLYRAVVKGHKDIVELLLKTGADVDTSDGCGSSLLHWAAFSGSLDIADLLIRHKVAQNVDAFGYSPLEVAAMRGHQKIVALLIEKVGSFEVRDKCGNTPLDWAAKKGHVETVEVLLKSGAVSGTMQGDSLDMAKRQCEFVKAAALF